MDKIEEIRSSISWKICIPFILLPLLSTGLFFISYEAYITSDVKIDNGIILFIGLLGLVGIWTFFIAILRAKTIVISDKKVFIKRIFTRQNFYYKIDEIISFSIYSGRHRYSSYEILMFKTKDNKIHSIVSYELIKYPEIKNWFHKYINDNANISVWSFFKNEYLIALIFALIVVWSFLKDLIWLEY